MDPRLQAIMLANARLVRFEAERWPAGPKAAFNPTTARAALQADLDEQCRRVLADLVPVVGAAGAAGGHAHTGHAAPLASFLRYLLRGMDMAERIAMLEAAREADLFVARLGGPKESGAGNDPAKTQLPAVLDMLGGSAGEFGLGPV